MSWILFLFANILIWRILFLFTNNFQSIHEYLILILNIYKEYEYISLWLCLPGKFSNEKYIRVKKKNLLEIFFRKKDIRYSLLFADHWCNVSRYQDVSGIIFFKEKLSPEQGLSQLSCLSVVCLLFVPSVGNHNRRAGDFRLKTKLLILKYCWVWSCWTSFCV